MLYGIPIQFNGITNVQQNFEVYFKLLTNKLLSLFKFSNLPDHIDETFLKEQLILKGKVCFTQFNSHLYALNGNWGGEPDCYYQPTTFIIANPVLGSKEVKVRNKNGGTYIDNLDGIVVSLSDLDERLQGNLGGYYPLIYKYSGLLADNDVSLNVAQINGRVSQIWTADNDSMARTVEEVVRDIYEGHPYRVVSQDILNKVGAVETAASGQANGTIINLIEAHRSLLQDFYNEIGIGYQGNAKRERVNTAEVGLMRGCLDLSIENVITKLKNGIEKVNELFGTDISVELNDEIFYEGSGNATLGVGEELEVEPTPDLTEEINNSAAVDEKNDEEVIVEAEERGKATKEDKVGDE